MSLRSMPRDGIAASFWLEFTVNQRRCTIR